MARARRAVIGETGRERGRERGGGGWVGGEEGLRFMSASLCRSVFEQGTKTQLQ